MIRYGILGFGHHAIKRMVPGFSYAQSSQLAGLWRRDPVKAEANARAYSIPRVFASAGDLCASPEIDAVFIASPDALHLADVLTAARHGKHILCEKPLAMNASEAEQMLSAANAAGIRFGVAQNMRYYRSLELIRQWIAEGRIGAPALAQSQFAFNAAASPRVWIYDSSLALGGPIGDVAIHCIDALRFILDTTVAQISTLAHRDAHSGSVESHAALALAFASGAMGAVTVTTRTAYRTVIEVVGETGAILCENGLTVDHPVEVMLRRRTEVESVETVSNADAYGRMLDGFSAWIEGGVEYRSPGTDGLINQRILDAAYRSWRTGETQTP
ncbi:Gfo/Idh/MocA family protein [Paracidobacterium acidisoli]|uniref:Gfo/Idh/MocA family oxidoreductase n=1 Tax=Paracidobacterium acidisoli TaxID=2303751 RepID=A0A372IMC8_9BACT|nr:Gfo/Idh/MocA family oxidoreductase [Paracidobacterium acidisoli]MBT9331751.1 Gfo/Idh/MocA family oxidoreductase [Paracidobacterium acidisoli]